MTCTGSAKRYHLCNTKVSSRYQPCFSFETQYVFAHQKYNPDTPLDSTIELQITPTFTTWTISEKMTFPSFHFPLDNGKQTIDKSQLTESVIFRNAPQLEGVSERSSAGHLTLRYSMERITTGNPFTQVLDIGISPNFTNACLSSKINTPFVIL